jgi:CelD/BcsL family acetyltransferase involved in cellulose biosynthesis
MPHATLTDHVTPHEAATKQLPKRQRKKIKKAKKPAKIVNLDKLDELLAGYAPLSDVAEACDKSERFFQRLIQQRRVTFTKMGRTTLLNLESVGDLLSAAEVEAIHPRRGR